MRIVFDYQVFAFQKYGGISRYFVRLLEGILARPAHTARIIAPLHVNAYLAALPHGSVSGYAIGSSNLNQRIARNISKRVACPLIALEKPDIVHETYFAPRSSTPRGVPTVLTVYDMIHERFAESFAPNDPTRAMKRAAVLRADHILCISQSTERDLVEYIPEAVGKTSVTLLGFDSFAKATGSVSPSNDRPYLLYVGERKGYKNFSGLLRAYAASPKLRASFGVRCFGGGAPTADERELIGSLGLAPEMVVFDSGDDRALAASYRGATAFVYPSLYEGFGIPPLEAMSASCPVVASDRSSIPEICGDAAVYFDPDDTDSIREAMEATVFDTGLSAALVAAGIRRLGAFSWDRCAAETLQVYGGLL